jgi:hypothetical protein
MNLLAQAPEIIANAVKRGLMSYPANTKFSVDGRPIPRLDDVRHKKSPMEQFACLRAWEMHQAGDSYGQIAARIRCPLTRIEEVLAHGKAIQERKAIK